ncbi:MAG: ABC transporter ATP-binding protein/permease [Lachnospiraceae bacterium]|nr:ABC transporter ATP-binding protein/permease [Lachnospiraceae bacterium]
MTPVKWFWGFLKKYSLPLFIGLLMTTAISVLSIVNPYISGLIVDDVIRGGALDKLPQLIMILLSVTLVRGALRFAHQVIFESCSQGVLYDMRDKFFRRLLVEDLAFYNRKKTGDLMSRQTGDMDAIRHFTAYIIYAVYENLLMFAFALLMIFTVNVKLALCMLFVLPFTALTTVRQSKEVRPTFARIRSRFSSLNSFVQENVSGNRVVKAFAKEDFEIEKFNRENDAYQEAQLASSRVWMKYLPVFEVLSYLLNVVLMFYGGYMVIQGEITMGNLVTVNGYLWMLNVPLRMAGWWVNDIHRFLTSVEKIYDTYVEEPRIKMPSAPVKSRHFEGNIEFRNVSYSADGEDIVRDISFAATKGQTIGILGSTGAGKSTLMNLLCRFVDAETGQVLVDGVNVKDLDLYELRDNIGMAMQDIFLFSDTIEGNIAYGRPNCSFEEIHEAAVMADANHFIKEMPEGYDTIVGERGVGLSGGQKQRISLARALLKKPSILILDDTTSAVDMETESYIQSQLKKLNGQCTVFVIAYRISSIKDADLILVMDNGRIIERGTHQELLARNGYYASAFNHQYGEIPSPEEMQRAGLQPGGSASDVSLRTAAPA